MPTLLSHTTNNLPAFAKRVFSVKYGMSTFYDFPVFVQEALYPPGFVHLFIFVDIMVFTRTFENYSSKEFL
jgi:hypothetical protein